MSASEQVELLTPALFPPGSNPVFTQAIIGSQKRVGEIDGEQKSIKERLDEVEEKNTEQDGRIGKNETDIKANTEKNAVQDEEIAANTEKNQQQDEAIQANTEKNELQDEAINTNAGNISTNATNIQSITEVLETVNGSIIGDKDVATVDVAGLVKQVVEASIVGPLNPGEQDPAVIVEKINELALAWSRFVRYAFAAGIIKTENNSEDFQE